MEQGKKEYEISFLLNSPENESEIIGILTANQVETLNKSQISEIKLAYPIKKRNSAFFGYHQFKALPEDVKKISVELKLKPDVLRFLVLKQLTKIVLGRPTFPVKLTKPVEPEVVKPKSETLSNELLEKKLEEILK